MRLLPSNGHISGGSIRLLGRDLATLDEREMGKVRGQRGRPHPPRPPDLPQSDHDPRPADHRGGHAPPRRLEAGGAQPGAGSAHHGRDAPARRAAGAVPPRTLGRPAPAGDDRHGPGLRTQAAHRRRADDGAGRDHPGADPRPHRRVAGATADGGRPDHPRHGGHRRSHRPGGGDVRREDRRGGHHPPPVRGHAPPLLRSPPRFGPQGRSEPGRTSR